MTPEFSTHVDPVFLCVIDLLEQIRKKAASPAVTVRDTVRRQLDDAIAKLRAVPGAELAWKALIYWTDEMMIEADWEGHSWWNNNKLETELLGSNDRYRLFYQDAKEASALPDRNALEVFYLCVVLGFRGLYRDPDSDESRASRETLELAPATLEEWIRQTSKGIRSSNPPSIAGEGESIEGVYPLEGPTTLVWAVFFLFFLLVLTGTITWLTLLPS